MQPESGTPPPLSSPIKGEVKHVKRLLCHDTSVHRYVRGTMPANRKVLIKKAALWSIAAAALLVGQVHHSEPGTAIGVPPVGHMLARDDQRVSRRHREEVAHRDCPIVRGNDPRLFDVAEYALFACHAHELCATARLFAARRLMMNPKPAAMKNMSTP